MTDKEQIIIDGKGCRYKTWDAECSLTGDHYGDNMKPCKFIDEKSCYFKQLARKTQIVEQQQKTLDELIGCVSLWEEFTEEESKLAKDSSIADLVVLLRKKTQEYEELKRQYESRKGLLNSVGKDNYRLMQECEELEKRNKFLLSEVRDNISKGNWAYERCKKREDRYRKALDEIEEYCNNQISLTGDLPFRTTESDILDIINKSKGLQ